MNMIPGTGWTAVFDEYLPLTDQTIEVQRPVVCFTYDGRPIAWVADCAGRIVKAADCAGFAGLKEVSAHGYIPAEGRWTSSDGRRLVGWAVFDGVRGEPLLVGHDGWIEPDDNDPDLLKIAPPGGW